MSDTFTASNGSKVRWVGEELGIGDPPLAPLTDKGVVALREFFRHERDRGLGRWRWPENPSLVAYACDAERCVRVLDERTGVSQLYVEGQMSEYQGDRADAARAYFAAHPEPKPWHDAEPGEVWAITTENVADEVAVQVTPESTFQYNDGHAWPIRDMPIVTARRIWPEGKP